MSSGISYNSSPESDGEFCEPETPRNMSRQPSEEPSMIGHMSRFNSDPNLANIEENGTVAKKPSSPVRNIHNPSLFKMFKTLSNCRRNMSKIQSTASIIKTEPMNQWMTCLCLLILVVVRILHKKARPKPTEFRPRLSATKSQIEVHLRSYKTP